MIPSYEETNRGCLSFLTREIIITIIVGLLMSLPCVLCFTLILSTEGTP